MPFGLTNAPTTFQSLMNEVFRPLLREYVLVFFDDILIYNRNLSDHLLHLTEVIKLLCPNELKLKKSKCLFGQYSVEYLGHVITAQGVAVDPKKNSMH